MGSVTNWELDNTLSLFWELESMGILLVTSDSVSDQFIENGWYEVSLRWCEYHDPLPDNYELSCQRLRGLLKRLKQEPAIL